MKQNGFRHVAGVLRPKPETDIGKAAITSDDDPDASNGKSLNASTRLVQSARAVSRPRSSRA
ncbi:hypothetical protein GCM10020216_105460 [Nonomuraea helvata]